ncbi:hypothetical protein D3C78_1834350 [compost metagenome]
MEVRIERLALGVHGAHPGLGEDVLKLAVDHLDARMHLADLGGLAHRIEREGAGGTSAMSRRR